MSTSQFIAILAFATAVWMALILRRKPARQQAWGVEIAAEVARGNPRDKKLDQNVAQSARVKAATLPQAAKRARG
jgi:hypothetical protein